MIDRSQTLWLEWTDVLAKSLKYAALFVIPCLIFSIAIGLAAWLVISILLGAM